MYSKIRRVLSLIMIVGITLLFLDFTGTIRHFLGWMARVQFMPAVLSLNVVIIVALAVVTLLLGRVYCSVICPLGIFQDLVSWFRGKRDKKARRRFSFSRERRILRYTMLALFVAAIIAGLGSLVALLDPYGAYGRIATTLFQPLWAWCNNALAAIAAHFDSYAVYSTEVWVRSLPTLLIAVATLVLVVILAWRGGRTYCNTICPVGTTLGLLSRFALFRFIFDEEKCINCGACERNCKSSCVDYKNHKVDHSRCVACGNCADSCKVGAIALRFALGNVGTGHVASAPAEPGDPNPDHSNTRGGGAVDKGKRAFLIGGAMALGGAALAQTKKKLDGGLAVIEDKKVPERQTPITPPGSLSARNMARHCTACQLCVAECPNQVLRPSDSLATLMQPVLSYERGNFCRPECTRCGDICPTGAIHPLSREEKASTQIGHAVWVLEHCLPLNDKTEDGKAVECGNCARHCPTGAIRMRPFNSKKEDSPLVPFVNDEQCIGCGACESVCPARPFTAIYVEGHDTHKLI